VPSFDHRVTQCRSTVTFSVGSSRNDFQFHRRKTFDPSSIVNSHFSSAMCGVGPAERTGKSVVRYCPGGSFASVTARLPKKPREMVPIRTSPVRESANWLKSQSLIGKAKSFASQTSLHHFCSEHAGCHEPGGDPRRSWLPDCKRLRIAPNAKLRPVRKRSKQLILPIRFCARAARPCDQLCIPWA